MSDSCYMETKWCLETQNTERIMAYYLPHLFVVHSSFNKYLLVTYNTPGIVLGTDREAIQEDNNLCSCEAYILVWQINNIKNLVLKVTGALG